MIDCLKCGRANPPGSTRCTRCNAYLPVTMAASDEQRKSARAEWSQRRHGGFDAEFDDGFDDMFEEDKDGEEIDYRSSGGSTLIHEVGRSSSSSRQRQDVPFDLEPTIDVDDDDGIFTSAELLEEAFNARERRVEYRKGELIEIEEEPEEPPAPPQRTSSSSSIAEPSQDDLPLSPPTSSSGSRPRPGARRRSESAPRVSESSRARAGGRSLADRGGPGQVAYVPGKGIVPAEDAPDTPAAPPQRPPNRPPPLPSRTSPTPSGARPPVRRPGATPLSSSRSGRHAAIERRPLKDKNDSTVVDARPMDQIAREELGEVAQLGHAFTGAQGSGSAPAPPAVPREAGSASGGTLPAASTSGGANRAASPSGGGVPARSASSSGGHHRSLEDKLDAVRQSFTGRPRPQQTPSIRLGILGPEGRVSESLPLSRGRSIIGREEGDLTLSNDPTVSPWHAQVTVRKGGVYVKDMGSANGVYVRIRARQPLADGDSFVVGDQRFVYRSTWDPPAEGDALELGASGYEEAGRLLLKRLGGQVCGIYFIGESLTVGRARGDVVFGDDAGISAEHASVERAEGGHVLVDLDSVSGTFYRVDGERRLQVGDCVQLGRTRLQVIVE